MHSLGSPQELTQSGLDRSLAILWREIDRSPGVVGALSVHSLAGGHRALVLAGEGVAIFERRTAFGRRFVIGHLGDIPELPLELEATAVLYDSRKRNQVFTIGKQRLLKALVRRASRLVLG